MFESDNADYPGYSPSPWNLSYDAGHFANLVYDVPTAAAMQADINQAVADHAGNAFVTDDTLPNPYDTLPSYWDQEVAAIKAQNSVPEPGTLTLFACGLVGCGAWARKAGSKRNRESSRLTSHPAAAWR